MRTEKIFVFGHYDSRGGTTGILAETEDKAYMIYAQSFCLDTHDELNYWGSAVRDPLQQQIWEGMPLMAKIKAALVEDYIGEFTIEAEDDLFKVNVDLEWADDGEDRLAVLRHRTDNRLKIVKEHDFGEEGEPQSRNNAPEQEEGLPDYPNNPGWYHPRWDDDAFSFVITDARGEKP